MATASASMAPFASSSSPGSSRSKRTRHYQPDGAGSGPRRFLLKAGISHNLKTSMLKRISIGLGAILLVASVAVVIWLGSFNKGSHPRPEDPSQTFVFFALSILIFILMMGLG